MRARGGAYLARVTALSALAESDPCQLLPPNSDLAKQLPNNIEAERSILSTILADPGVLGRVQEHLSSGDFFLSAHIRIFRAVLAMSTAGRKIDEITLIEHLQSQGELDNAGGAAYVASLRDPLYRVGNVEDHAAIVRRKARLRLLVFAGDKLSRDALDTQADLNVLERQLHDLLKDPGKTSGKGARCYSAMDFLGADFPAPEHLVEGLIPRESTVMIFALPHSLKSWFTLGLAIASTRPGLALGKLEVKKPVRTMLIQVEDFPGQLQWRMREILRSEHFRDWDPANLRVIPRCGFNLPDASWHDWLAEQVEQFKPDHMIFDVLRRIFRGNINDPKETGLFLEQVDTFREVHGATTTLVHHENRKQAEIMLASAGSYNLPGWANVMIQFKRKTEHKTEHGPVTRVEMEVDNKLAESIDPLCMVLELGSVVPLRMEALEDSIGITEAQERLGAQWTVKELMEVANLEKTSAFRRIKKWIDLDKVEKISQGKAGRSGGLARYRFLTASE